MPLNLRNVRPAQLQPRFADDAFGIFLDDCQALWENDKKTLIKLIIEQSKPSASVIEKSKTKDADEVNFIFILEKGIKM